MSQVLEPLPQTRARRPQEVQVDPDQARRENMAHIKRNGISWATVAWFGAIHVGALAAPFFFSWKGLILAVFLHWLTGSIGICLAFHRMLTHDGMQTHRFTRYFLTLIGTLAGEGPCLYWVATHRKHHAFSDKVGDPHSPHDGPWWSHMLWMVPKVSKEDQQSLYSRWIPDLKDERGLQILEAAFLPAHILFGAMIYGIGYWLGGSYMAMSLLLWGMFLRLALVLHATWMVNSASHIWGYRNYETTDDSRNNWFVAIITYGEGWHNNHHAFPRNARHGHRWWEVDMTFGAVRILKALGLAWDIVEGQQDKKNAQPA